MTKSYTTTSGTGTFCVPFPQVKFRKYLKSVRASPRKKLTKEQIQKIFLMTIKDFYAGALSLDDLSSIANEIYYPNIPIGDKDLGPALEDLSEISYIIRQAFPLLTPIQTYYEQYKHLLEK